MVCPPVLYQCLEQALVIFVQYGFGGGACHASALGRAAEGFGELHQHTDVTCRRFVDGLLDHELAFAERHFLPVLGDLYGGAQLRLEQRGHVLRPFRPAARIAALPRLELRIPRRTTAAYATFLKGWRPTHDTSPSAVAIAASSSKLCPELACRAISPVSICQRRMAVST